PPGECLAAALRDRKVAPRGFSLWLEELASAASNDREFALVGAPIERRCHRGQPFLVLLAAEAMLGAHREQLLFEEVRSPLEDLHGNGHWREQGDRCLPEFALKSVRFSAATSGNRHKCLRALPGAKCRRCAYFLEMLQFRIQLDFL